MSDPLAEIKEQRLKIGFLGGLCHIIRRPVLPIGDTSGFPDGGAVGRLGWRRDGVEGSVDMLAFQATQGKVRTGTGWFLQVDGIRLCCKNA